MSETSCPAVYMIINTATGDRYIGSAVNAARRWNGHKHLLRKNKHHAPYLQNAWNKYGEEAFEFSVLEKCDRPDLRRREQFWLDAERPTYNVSTVATSPTHEPAVREKIGIASKERGRVFLVDGTLMCVSEIAEGFGVSHGVFYSRLSRGWECTRAAKTPPRQKHTVSGAAVHEYNGKLYTLSGLLEFASCSKTALFRRIKSGMSVKEAVELTPEDVELRRVQLIREARARRK